MPRPGRRHDRAILDALENKPAQAFSGAVWRVTVAGRDPLRGSAAGGRWSPSGEFDVLYTSLAPGGALAEIGFRLSLEPVWPTGVRHELHKIEARTQRTLMLRDLQELLDFEIDPGSYTGFDYTKTQALAAAANFIGFDSIVVPSARSPDANAVLFLEALASGGALRLVDTETVDWDAWRARRSPQR